MKFSFHSEALFALLVVTTIKIDNVSGTLASPFPFEELNADGSPTGEMYVFGGPGNSWLEDKNGFTICPVVTHPDKIPQQLSNEDSVGNADPETTFYYCGKDKNGDVVPRMDLQVGRESPQASGLKPNVGKNENQIEEECGAFCEVDDSGRRLGEFRGSHRKLQGTLKNLVVLMRFSDHSSRNFLPTVAEVDDLMNAESPTASCPTGSVKQVFLENSNGRLILDSTVYQWVTLDPVYTETYCANDKSGLDVRIHECIANALDKVEAGGLDFRDFDQDNDGLIDAITFLHSGYGAEWNGASNRIWSHKWSLFTIEDGGEAGWTSSVGVSVFNYHINPSLWGSTGTSIGRIGVIAHETGHFLGLPDLYDIDGGGKGLNSWSLMANSWGFDSSQLYPPLLDPWCKIQLGWVTPTVLTETSRNIEIKPSYTDDDYYIIQRGFPEDEFLLIEYRRRVGYDSLIPEEGLLIYHIDDTASFDQEGFPGQTGWPENGNHYRVALLQADGEYDLEQFLDSDAGDVFRGGRDGASSLGPGPDIYPNTDSYQSGSVTKTGILIENISLAGDTVTFDFVYEEEGVPSLMPSGVPSLMPSGVPTATPREPTASPREPTATPREPTATPGEPTPTPREPTASPRDPTASPREPSATPREPTATPREPTAPPSSVPTTQPTGVPSFMPTADFFSSVPSHQPTRVPITLPTNMNNRDRGNGMKRNRMSANDSVHQPNRNPKLQVGCSNSYGS
ncbi:predicted protein [Phaeodactylum tricornutum CCAP 1055/1]|uniref:Peptidase M6-like domain-containing protein n=2 Tax=Phaeodactylum tricornutum TaxID=2850 RepID=B7FUZ7_PHATC|nr:predicted protein [Phaeodactylum tricornutum CCAP 1055/1]EEC50348.1 predicted protein [Phaeodactylum tricornutum CCAP 1055/1]|eukprot:XP_002178683.1 predicted protein [Phaeodactylum tricornutum CCAP 1055/1]